MNNEYFRASVERLDLTDVEDFTYSAFLRKLRQKLEYNYFLKFIQIFKSEFDAAVASDVQEPEKISLQKTLIKFNRTVMPIKITKSLIKNAAVSELGNPEEVGKYLSNIVRFILKRIAPQNRAKSVENLRQKFYDLNAFEISTKKMPASSALGQSITFVKHVLFNHDARYIKRVLDSLAKNL